MTRNLLLALMVWSVTACGAPRRSGGRGDAQGGGAVGFGGEGSDGAGGGEAGRGEGQAAGEGEGEGQGAQGGGGDGEDGGAGGDGGGGDVGVDTDQDRLSDADEADLGTDPAKADTDEDGYLDGHEVQAGTDPMDAQSVIYEGGWPYNPDKDEMEQGGWDVPPATGTLLPRWTATDQYGDTVDMYDFIGDGKPILLDVGTRFCKPCKGMAAWLATGDSSAETARTEGALDSFLWWNEDFEVVYDMVQNEEIRWITVLWSSCTGNSTATTPQDAVDWHEEWPNHHVPVLVDPDCQFKDYLQVVAMPHIDILDEDLRFLLYETGGPVPGFRAAAAMGSGGGE